MPLYRNIRGIIQEIVGCDPEACLRFVPGLRGDQLLFPERECLVPGDSIYRLASAEELKKCIQREDLLSSRIALLSDALFIVSRKPARFQALSGS
jgi:hypothetical protein